MEMRKTHPDEFAAIYRPPAQVPTAKYALSVGGHAHDDLARFPDRVAEIPGGYLSLIRPSVTFLAFLDNEERAGSGPLPAEVHQRLVQRNARDSEEAGVGEPEFEDEEDREGDAERSEGERRQHQRVRLHK